MTTLLNGPEQISQACVLRHLQRQVFYLWTFVAQEGLLDDAHAFLNDHKDLPSPLEIDLSEDKPR